MNNKPRLFIPYLHILCHAVYIYIIYICRILWTHKYSTHYSTIKLTLYPALMILYNVLPVIKVVSVHIKNYLGSSRYIYELLLNTTVT